MKNTEIRPGSNCGQNCPQWPQLAIWSDSFGQIGRKVNRMAEYTDIYAT